MPNLSTDSNNIIEMVDIHFKWKPELPDTLNIPKLHIKKGEHLFIKGPSGCGKSTLLGLLTGINTPSEGQLSILNQTVSDFKPSQRDRFRADHIGYIFQQFNLLPYLSVIDNVILPCQFSKRRHQQVSQELKLAAKELLLSLRLPKSVLNKPVIELSIGQQQRVAAARALIGKPEIIIADEPTSALDHDNRTAFIQILMEQANAAQSTLIFVSHDPTLESLFNRSIDLPSLNEARIDA